MITVLRCPLKSHRRHPCNEPISKPILTCEQFKEQFKVDDRIMGYPTNLVFTITAIGISKFLYLDSGQVERWSTIQSAQARWRKPKGDPVEF